MGSPSEEGEGGEPRDLKEGERGWKGRNMHSGYPFSKIQVLKDLPLYCARVLIKLMKVPTSGIHTMY